MQKGKVNITMDKDLIEYAKAYAEEQRTTTSKVFTQFTHQMALPLLSSQALHWTEAVSDEQNRRFFLPVWLHPPLLGLQVP